MVTDIAAKHGENQHEVRGHDGSGNKVIGAK